MLGWSINLFRVRGIQLAVHASFFLLLAWVAKEGWDENGQTGLIWSVAMLIAFFTCVVLHEFGHSFTAMHFGIGVRRILLMPIGGMAEFDAIPRQPSRELLITLAGPAVNFVIAGGLWFVIRNFENEVPYYSLQGAVEQLFVANLYMGCFNLLPAFPMDGGRILRAVLATRLTYLRATWWAATIGKVVCVIGVAFALWFHHWLLAVLATFIFSAGQSEYKAVRRREHDDARWREMMAAHDRLRNSSEPPPLLP
jgi:Zn-dependent protease